LWKPQQQAPVFLHAWTMLDRRHDLGSDHPCLRARAVSVKAGAASGKVLTAPGPRVFTLHGFEAHELINLNAISIADEVLTQGARRAEPTQQTKRNGDDD